MPSTTPIFLGHFHDGFFDAETDIMSIKVHEDTEIDCKIEDIILPDFKTSNEELQERVFREGEKVEVKKAGFPPDTPFGYIVQMKYTHRDDDGNILFKDAFVHVVKGGFSSSFLEDGDSGSLVSFLDKKDEHQAFAYGVVEIDDICQVRLDSDQENENLKEMSSGEGAHDPDEMQYDECNSNIEGSDSDDDFFVDFRECGPFSLCFSLVKGLNKLSLKAGCFTLCGSHRVSCKVKP